MKKLLLLCGIATPIVYLFTVVLGGLLRPGYSHTAQAVSSLIADGAPNKALLDPLFGLYNLLTLAFGVGLFQSIRALPAHPRKNLGLVAAAVLIVEGLAGFATLFFPQPGEGAPMGPTGMMHIALASVTSVTTMLTMLLLGFWFRATASFHRLGVYSFLSVLIVFLSGGMAAASMANGLPIAGLVERITIGGFLQWLLVVAYRLYRSTGPVPAAGASKPLALPRVQPQK